MALWAAIQNRAEMEDDMLNFDRRHNIYFVSESLTTAIQYP
jgi:hypothetical protein